VRGDSSMVATATDAGQAITSHSPSTIFDDADQTAQDRFSGSFFTCRQARAPTTCRRSRARSQAGVRDAVWATACDATGLRRGPPANRAPIANMAYQSRIPFLGRHVARRIGWRDAQNLGEDALLAQALAADRRLVLRGWPQQGKTISQNSSSNRARATMFLHETIWKETETAMIRFCYMRLNMNATGFPPEPRQQQYKGYIKT